MNECNSVNSSPTTASFTWDMSLGYVSPFTILKSQILYVIDSEQSPNLRMPYSHVFPFITKVFLDMTPAIF